MKGLLVNFNVSRPTIDPVNDIQLYNYFHAYYSIGQFEHTILKTFIRTGKIRRWLGKPGNSSGVLEVKKLFDKYYLSGSSTASGNAEGSGEEDGESDGEHAIQTFQPTSVIPAELRGLLNTRNVKLHARMSFKQVTFSTFRSHPGNSQILIRPPGYTMNYPIPGIINYICNFSNGSWRFVVREVLPIPQGEVDKYSIYMDFPARRTSTRLSDNFRVVEPSWVESQFLSWKEDAEHLVIVPVSPVRCPYIIQVSINHL